MMIQELTKGEEMLDQLNEEMNTITAQIEERKRKKERKRNKIRYNNIFTFI